MGRCLRSSGLIQLRFRRRHRATPCRSLMIPSLQLALTMKRMYCQTLHLKILRPALQLWVTISSFILTRRFQMTIAHHCNWQMRSVKINCTPLIEIFVCGTTVWKFVHVQRALQYWSQMTRTCISTNRDLRARYHNVGICVCLYGTLYSIEAK